MASTTSRYDIITPTELLASVKTLFSGDFSNQYHDIENRAAEINIEAMNPSLTLDQAEALKLRASSLRSEMDSLSDQYLNSSSDFTRAHQALIDACLRSLTTGIFESDELGFSLALGASAPIWVTGVGAVSTRTTGLNFIRVSLATFKAQRSTVPHSDFVSRLSSSFQTVLLDLAHCFDETSAIDNPLGVWKHAVNTRYLPLEDQSMTLHYILSNPKSCLRLVGSTAAYQSNSALMAAITGAIVTCVNKGIFIDSAVSDVLEDDLEKLRKDDIDYVSRLNLTYTSPTTMDRVVIAKLLEGKLGSPNTVMEDDLSSLISDLGFQGDNIDTYNLRKFYRSVYSGSFLLQAGRLPYNVEVESNQLFIFKE